MTFLSPTEQAFLNGSREFTKAQRRYIRCRLKKKIRLLQEESCNAAARLQRLDNAQVAQSGRALRELILNEKDKILRIGSLGGDLDPGPLPIRDYAKERNLTKVTLYQAELPRQLNEQSNQCTL